VWQKATEKAFVVYHYQEGGSPKKTTLAARAKRVKRRE
jgi:hypothetical protein